MVKQNTVKQENKPKTRAKYDTLSIINKLPSKKSTGISYGPCAPRMYYQIISALKENTDISVFPTKDLKDYQSYPKWAMFDNDQTIADWTIMSGILTYLQSLSNIIIDLSIFSSLLDKIVRPGAVELFIKLTQMKHDNIINGIGFVTSAHLNFIWLRLINKIWGTYLLQKCPNIHIRHGGLFDKMWSALTKKDINKLMNGKSEKCIMVDDLIMFPKGHPYCGQKKVVGCPTIKVPEYYSGLKIADYAKWITTLFVDKNRISTKCTTDSGTILLRTQLTEYIVGVFEVVGKNPERYYFPSNWPNCHTNNDTAFRHVKDIMVEKFTEFKKWDTEVEHELTRRSD